MVGKYLLTIKIYWSFFFVEAAFILSYSLKFSVQLFIENYFFDFNKFLKTQRNF